MVSVILRTIEERSGIVGRIVISLVGLAWSVLTFLVLPIIVIEGVGATQAIRSSVNLFRKTWGEQLAAQLGLGLVGFVAAIPGVLLAVAGFFSGGGAAMGALIGLGLLWVLAVVVVMAALSGVFQTALYHFAVDGGAPSGYFDDDLMAEAFSFPAAPLRQVTGTSPANSRKPSLTREKNRREKSHPPGPPPSTTAEGRIARSPGPSRGRSSTVL